MLNGLASDLDSSVAHSDRKSFARAALGLDDSNSSLTLSSAKRHKLKTHTHFCVRCHKAFKSNKALSAHLSMTIKKNKSHVASKVQIKLEYKSAAQGRKEAAKKLNAAPRGDADEAQAQREKAQEELEEAEEVLRDALLNRTILERIEF